jgi:hypothetical protein
VYLYLWLALFWGVLGVAWLAWRWVDPQAPDPLVRWTNISGGWLALMLAAYNLLRWWGRRAQREQDRAWTQRTLPRHTTPPPQAPDPRFDFRSSESDEP